MPSTGPEVLLVRHGETEWSAALKHTGSTDVPLTDAGRRQAQRLAAALAVRDFARVMTSPLSRAVETCRLAGLGEHAEVREDLREWNYGEYEGATTAEIRAERPDWRLWRDGCPGGESPAEVGARADRVVAELRELDGDAAVVGHGHMLRVLAARWLDLPPARGASLALSTGALSALGWERENAAIWLWNQSADGL
ncbi:MAG: histidine phosphatase family protein [Solirubrobacteraceae bacterium]